VLPAGSTVNVGVEAGSLVNVIVQAQTLLDTITLCSGTGSPSIGATCGP